MDLARESEAAFRKRAESRFARALQTYIARISKVAAARGRGSAERTPQHDEEALRRRMRWFIQWNVLGWKMPAIARDSAMGNPRGGVNEADTGVPSIRRGLRDIADLI